MTKIASFFLTSMLFFIITDEISGQTESGNILIGGGSQLSLSRLNTSWESNLNDPKRTTAIEFSPHFGFFISNSLVLGGMVPLTRVTERVNMIKEKVTSAAIGPFFRYYLQKEGNISTFFQAMSGPGHMRMTKSWEKEIISYRMFVYEIDLGIAFFVNENVSFDLILGYASAKYNKITSIEPDESDIFFTKGLGIKLGLAVIL